MVDARRYHEETNQSPQGFGSSSPSMDPENKPRPFKAYVDVPTAELPESDPPDVPALEAISISTPPSGNHDAIDRQMVSTLCYLAAGITQETEYKGEQVHFRAASCTGNLHHIDLYLVCDDLGDLSAGVYHFDPVDFELEVLRRGDHRGLLARANGDGSIATSPLTIVATSTWWRNAWKYTERTYRHAFWDGGTVLANLLAAAHASDLPAAVITAFADDSVVELLGVDPTIEAPIAAVSIGTGATSNEPVSIETIDPTTKPLSPDPQEYPLIHDAWEQSTLEDGDTAMNWRVQCQEVSSNGRSDPGDGERIDLDPVGPDTATKRPLVATVERRGSKRQYREQGPSRRQLGTILDRATRGIPGDWNDGEADGPTYLDTYVLTTNVAEVPDGTYHYHPADDSLERLGDTSSDDQQHLALDQPWGGEAHVSVYLMADIDAIVSTLGNRGYRLAQLEAGITLGRLYLATAAHRTLGGTGLTFYDEAVNEYLQPRAGDQLPMTLFAFGNIDMEAGQRL